MESTKIDKYQIFNKWCKDNGVIYPKLEYPSYFDFNLIGVRAKEDIQHREAFLFIPFKMLISVDIAKNHPKIRHVYIENPQLFSISHDDYEQLTLAVFLLYEYQKGKNSFWYPYLQLMPDVEFFCNWPESDLNEIEDKSLIEEAGQYKQDVEDEWIQIERILKKYPQHFKESIIDKSLFMKIFAQVCSRCFGWGLPSTSMIPMADNLNHSDMTIIQEIIHKDYQLEADENSKYFVSDKFKNDYSALYSTEDIQKYQSNITGSFDRQRYLQAKQLYTVENWKQEIQKREIWELTYLELDNEEDNDSSEEEDEFEDQIGQSKIDKIKTDLTNPMKGFKFFIEQEQKSFQKFQNKIQSLKQSQQKEKQQIQSEAQLEEQDITKNLTKIHIMEDPTKENQEETQLDYQYEDEDFTWYTNKIKDETYFVMVNCSKKTIKKGQQVYYCYGRRTNNFLLLNYGFAIMDNKFDSFSFRIKLTLNIDSNNSNITQILSLPKENERLYDEEIRLKIHQLNITLLGYLRTVLRKVYKKEIVGNIMLTKPKNIDYEIFIFQKYIELMEFLLNLKEKSTTLEQDLQELQDSTINYRKRFALTYRLEKKKILRSNIDLAKYLLSILVSLKENLQQDFKTLKRRKIQIMDNEL